MTQRQSFLSLFCVTFFLLFLKVDSAWNATEYQEALKLFNASDSCFVPKVISTFCWSCNGTYMTRNRYVYRARCKATYGETSSVKLLKCSHKRIKNLCKLTCDTGGQKSCCPNRYGPLCLKCPVGKATGYRRSSNMLSVCSGRGKCTGGVRGNGVCACRYNYRGTACQICRKGYYGKYCQYRCRCGNGYCVGGYLRKCICKSGWQGIYCNKKISKCPPCAPNEQCISPGICRCKIGYEGQNCTESDLCAPGKNPCGRFASCKVSYDTGRQRREVACSCLPGFKGDGYQCILNNPCSSGFRCKLYERCSTILGNMPKCTCHANYERVNGTCVAKKCKYPEKCPKNSICVYEAAYVDEQICRCQRGFIGANCVITLTKLVSQLSAAKKYSGKTGVMLHIARKLERSITPRKITVFLPLSKPNSDFFKNLEFTILNRHVILAQVNLKRNKDYYNAYGEKVRIEITNPNNGTTDIGTIYVNNMNITIKSQYTYVGGHAYVIAGLIENPSDKYKVKSGTKNAKEYLRAMSKSMANLFNPMLPRSIRRYLLIVFPINDLTTHEYQYLLSNDAVAKYKRRRLVSSMTLVMQSTNYFNPVLQYIRGLRVITSRSWKLAVSPNGQFYLSGSRIIMNRIFIDDTIILLVDKPFTSALPKPILPGVCNLKETHIFTVHSPGSCPRGTIKLTTNRWSKIIKCQREALLKRQCCPGFFGPRCDLHCPGPYKLPCYKHGKCYDGLKGSGKCLCDSNYKGLACEQCSSPEYYGPHCNKTCKCLHGICDSGTIFSTGKCKLCSPGYRGEMCEMKRRYCNNSTQLTCKENEHCELILMGKVILKATCICDDGYIKKDDKCIPYNPCEDPAGIYGRCHEEARCHYLGPGNSTCICQKGWYGDGTLCEKEWGECKKKEDCNARGSVCVRGKCQCSNGLSYSKKRQCIRKFDCKINNGGCHPYAICLPDAPDYNSHCKCRENVPGDGFICLVSWTHAPQLQEQDNDHLRLVTFRLKIIRSKVSNSYKGPFTIFYPITRSHSQDETKAVNIMVMQGLYFLPDPKNRYLTADFFYQTATMKKLVITKENNITYVGGSKVIVPNIYVQEGLLHIVDEYMTVKPNSTTMFGIRNTSNSNSNSSNAPILLLYPLETDSKKDCEFKSFNHFKIHVTRIVNTSNSTTLGDRIPPFWKNVKTRWFKNTFNKRQNLLTSTMSFCGSANNTWPKGTYCLWPLWTDTSQSSCPSGFFPTSAHHVKFTSQNLTRNNRNYYIETVDDFMIKFKASLARSLQRQHKSPKLCCRKDSENVTFPLPNFNLFSYKGLCSKAPGRYLTETPYTPFLFTANFDDSFVMCSYKTQKPTPKPKVDNYSRLAYLVFDEKHCPRSQQLNFNGTKSIYRYPVFGIIKKRSKKILMCAMKDKKFWPPGSYCALKLNQTLPCPSFNGIRLRDVKVDLFKYKLSPNPWPFPHYGRNFVGLFDSSFHGFSSVYFANYNFCCGNFGRSKRGQTKTNFRKIRKSMPSFSLLKTRICPYIYGYYLTRDRIDFFRGFSTSISGTHYLPTCSSHFCLNLCHYSDKKLFSFALPKSIHGCERRFETGYRVQNLEKTDTRMAVHYLHLAGMFEKDKPVIRLEFCVNVGIPFKLPPGKYCIYRKMGQCPEGFEPGWAHFDDEDDWGASGGAGGTLPDGVYNQDSRYYFCCRFDANADIEVEMPFLKPFYLFKSPHSKTCQKVKNFVARHEVLMLDLEDARGLGKPAVVTNGSVPMTRGRTRGTDVDIHYCYYENSDKKDRPHSDARMGVLKYGPLCPKGAVTDTKGCEPYCNMTVCQFENSSLTWPLGHYCLLPSLPGQQCFKNFYRKPVKQFAYQHPVYDALKVKYICCRERPSNILLPPELDLKPINRYSFGLIGEACPRVKEMRLHLVNPFSYAYKSCFYTPLWPNTFDYSLPKDGKDCPPGFNATTIGNKYFKHSVFQNVLDNNESQYSKDIATIEICATSVSGKDRISWPVGKYCIFTTDKRVLKEFPIAISFRSKVTKKQTMSATFIFCRNDSSTDFSDKIPWQYLGFPTFSKCSKLSKQMLLRNFQEHEDKLESRMHIWNTTENHFVPDKVVDNLYTCFDQHYIEKKNESSNGSRTNDITGKCSCENPFAECNQIGICTCKRGFVGYGPNCIPCGCGKHATCSRGETSISPYCRCPLGFEGNGLYCNIIPYILPVKLPDTDSSHWPMGSYAFIKTYDNIRGCPPQFTEDRSRMIGRYEDVSFSVEPSVSLCRIDDFKSKKSWPEGNYCVWSKDDVCPLDLALKEILLPFQYISMKQNDTFIKKTVIDNVSGFTARFCCKSGKDNQITNFPPLNFFSLIRKGGKCPQLNYMSSIEQQFMLASGIEKFYIKKSTELESGDSLKKTDGPDFTWKKETKTLIMHLCNYYITQQVVYPKTCNTTTAMFCHPDETFYQVLIQNSYLMTLKAYLKQCNLFEKIKNLHHMQVTVFIDPFMLSRMGDKLVNLDCKVFGRHIALSRWPISIMLEKMRAGNQTVPTVYGFYGTLSKTNASNIFLYENNQYEYVPILFTRNGVIYKRVTSNVAGMISRKKTTNISYIGGGIAAFFIIVAVIAGIVWYIKRRNSSTSVSSFVNPVYYKPMEN